MLGVQGLRVFGYRGSGFARVVGFRVKAWGSMLIGFRDSGHFRVLTVRD